MSPPANKETSRDFKTDVRGTKTFYNFHSYWKLPRKLLILFNRTSPVAKLAAEELMLFSFVLSFRGGPAESRRRWAGYTGAGPVFQGPAHARTGERSGFLAVRLDGEGEGKKMEEYHGWILWGPRLKGRQVPCKPQRRVTKKSLSPLLPVK